MKVPEPRDTKLAILLPFTSRCFESEDLSLKALEEAVHRLSPLNNGAQAFLFVGVDRQDPIFQSLGQLSYLKEDQVILHPLDKEKLDKLAGVGLREIGGASNHVRGASPSVTPLCRIWEEMAVAAACLHNATAFVFLGDDIKLNPSNWSQIIIGKPKQPKR